MRKSHSIAALAILLIFAGYLASPTLFPILFGYGVLALTLSLFSVFMLRFARNIG